jgi:hypothetical protein
MLTEQKITNEQVTTFSDQAEAAELELGNSRFGIAIIMTMSCFVGAWGCLCLISGIAQAHNVNEIGRGIITAITGI